MKKQKLAEKKSSKPLFKERVQNLINARFKIWPDSMSQLKEQIKEEIEESDKIDSAELDQIIKEYVDNLLAADLEDTDFNRLDDAFNALIQKGIFCVHNIQTTPSSCWMGVKEQLDEYKQKKQETPTSVQFEPESIWAVAFYHFQDTERAAQGMPLSISYIAIADGEQEQIDTIKAKFLIMGILKQFNLKIISPSFDIEEKIFLDLKWQVPLSRVSNMEQNRGIAVEYTKNPKLDLPLEKYKQIIEEGEKSIDRSKSFNAYEHYYIDQLLDLILDDGEETKDKKIFLLEELNKYLEIKSLVFSKLSDQNMQELRRMETMSKFFMFTSKIPEEMKEMVDCFKIYESTKQAVKLLGQLFNQTKAEKQVAVPTPQGALLPAYNASFRDVTKEPTSVESKDKKSDRVKKTIGL